MPRIKCPNCESKNTCRIIYGLVNADPKLMTDLAAERVHLGGCLVSDHDPNRHCNDCEADFDTTNPDLIFRDDILVQPTTERD